MNNEFQDLINGGKSGNSYNVIKYTSDDGMFVAKDVRRAENTLKVLTDLQNKICELKKMFIQYRSNLFNSEHKIKDWEANELALLRIALKCMTKLNLNAIKFRVLSMT